MSKFDELLTQLAAENEAQETLAKALPQASQDDKSIQVAAEEGKDAGEEEGDGKKDVVKDENEGDGSLAKSLKIIGEDGEEIDALDATELLKSLQMQIGDHDEVLAKALPGVLGLIQKQGNMLAQQGELIKSLQGDIQTLAGQGRGRKTQIVITEKQAATDNVLAKSQPDGLTPQEFMLKANTAFDKKVISGLELRTVDACLRQGQVPSSDLITKIANS